MMKKVKKYTKVSDTFVYEKKHITHAGLLVKVLLY